MSRRDREQSVRIALGGMLGAGSLVILWLACIVPSGWLGLTAVAGLFPVTATLYAGRAAGYMCWAAGSLLGLVLLPNKGIPLLYLVFLVQAHRSAGAPSEPGRQALSYNPYQGE